MILTEVQLTRAKEDKFLMQFSFNMTSDATRSIVSCNRNCCMDYQDSNRYIMDSKMMSASLLILIFVGTLPISAL